MAPGRPAAGGPKQLPPTASFARRRGLWGCRWVYAGRSVVSESVCKPVQVQSMMDACERIGCASQQGGNLLLRAARARLIRDLAIQIGAGSIGCGLHPFSWGAGPRVFCPSNHWLAPSRRGLWAGGRIPETAIVEVGGSTGANETPVCRPPLAGSSAGSSRAPASTTHAPSKATNKLESKLGPAGPRPRARISQPAPTLTSIAGHE